MSTRRPCGVRFEDPELEASKALASAVRDRHRQRRQVGRYGLVGNEEGREEVVRVFDRWRPLLFEGVGRRGHMWWPSRLAWPAIATTDACDIMLSSAEACLLRVPSRNEVLQLWRSRGSEEVLHNGRAAIYGGTQAESQSLSSLNIEAPV